MDSRRRLRRTIDVVLVALVVIGAALFLWGRRDGGNPTGGIPPDLDPDSIAVRFPEDRIVWQVDLSSPGLSEVARAASRPSITIYGDGRMYLVQPAHDPRYDEPIPLRHDRLDPGLLSAFVTTAEKTGFFDDDADPDALFGTIDTPDLLTTTIEIHGRGRARTLEIYGLGSRFDLDVGEEQAERREQLRQILHDAEALATDPVVGDPDRIRILHLEDDASFEEAPEVETIDEPPEWPGPALDRLRDRAPAGIASDRVLGCGELRGDDAADLYEQALDNPLPRWLVDGHETTIITVMLLPDEPACG